jgi:6-phosphogluconolactonase
MNLQYFSTADSFITATVNFIADVCFKKKGIVHVALSGGSTPRPVYEALAKREDIDFSQVVFWQVDERYVPSNHPDSNLKMMNEALFNPLDQKLKRFYAFDTAVSQEEAVQKYTQFLKTKKEGEFDLVILGIGSDGHTASLFPQAEGLVDEQKLVASTITEQFTVRERLTLTFVPIMQSKKILVLLAGQDKERVINELQNPKQTVADFPAKKLLPHPDLNVFVKI